MGLMRKLEVTDDEFNVKEMCTYDASSSQKENNNNNNNNNNNRLTHLLE